MSEIEICENHKNYESGIAEWISIDTPPTIYTSDSTSDYSKSAPVIVFNGYTYDYFLAQYHYRGGAWDFNGIIFTNEEAKEKGFSYWMNIPWPLKEGYPYGKKII